MLQSYATVKVRKIWTLKNNHKKGEIFGYHVGVPVNDSLAEGHLIEDIGDKAAALVPGQPSFP